MKLSDLKPGEIGVITKILGHGAFRKRVIEMGFVRGREVKVVLNAPLQDPIKYTLMDYEVSLRRSESALIEITPLEEWQSPTVQQPITNESNESPSKVAVRKDKEINIALIGNPNCGKTSLFNLVSGAHEHVGNYSGVTVGAKAGYINYKGYRLNIVDLPGTYSLSAYSPEELYVSRYLKEETPDVIVNVTVASNLERNLYLTTELIDMNRSMVVALNMYDELERSKTKLDHENLGKLLGVPMVPTTASTGKGVYDLLDTVIEVYEMRNPDVRHIHVWLGNEIERSVTKLKDVLKGDPTLSQHFSPRYLAIKLLEKDQETERLLSENKNFKSWIALRDEESKRIEKTLKEDPSSAIASAKYGFISGALHETMEGASKIKEKATEIIDAFVTNKLFGFPIFIFLMWLMFWATFSLGSYPMEWIEMGVAYLADAVSTYMPDGSLKDLIVDGVIGGVGGVIVFLPNILILYLFISFMEDSGYMARVAFIMDKLMHKIGLHGKSFIPLVMGFGCNVPAIMSSRIIESKSSRIITILITPFMSCSARIPIYVLLVGCFFPQYGSLVFLGLYLLGIIFAILTARLLRRFWFKEDETPFVMELPPYRIPTAKATLRNMWSKAKQYVQKMGGLILVASIIIWALSYFPRHTHESLLNSEVAAQYEQAVNQEAFLNEYQQEHSYLGKIGKLTEPLVEPLGFDWKVSVSLLAGSAAKEVVVSTLGVLYTGQDDEVLLSQKLKANNPLTGKPNFTAISALAFLVFVLIYFPCIATIAAIVRETGSWLYGFFSIIYNTALAWILAFIVFQIGTSII